MEKKIREQLKHRLSPSQFCQNVIRKVVWVIHGDLLIPVSNT